MIDMDEAKLQTVAQVKAFLEGTHVIALKIPKAEQYRFIERIILKLLSYRALTRYEKGVVLRYLERMTSLTRQQITRGMAWSIFIYCDTKEIKMRDQLQIPVTH